MTHDTPHETENLRWCENCQISVEPSVEESGPKCPACGRELDERNV